jgi:hypothetical protein
MYGCMNVMFTRASEGVVSLQDPPSKMGCPQRSVRGPSGSATASYWSRGGKWMQTPTPLTSGG